MLNTVLSDMIPLNVTGCFNSGLVCQHFVKAMVIFIQSSSCNEAQGKNKIDVSNEIQIQNILSNCSVVCCSSIGASGTNLAMGLILSFIAISIYFYED